MVYTADEIKKNWKKSGSMKMNRDNYSTWEKEDLIAGIHDDDNEVVIVLNAKTGVTIQEHIHSYNWGLSIRDKLKKTSGDVVIEGVVAVKQISKEDYEKRLVDRLPIVQIIKEMEAQMPSNWKCHYVKSCDECDKKPCVVICYIRKDIDVKVFPHAPMVSFCCPIGRSVFDIRCGYADEPSPQSSSTFESSEPSGMEMALRFMENNNG